MVKDYRCKGCFWKESDKCASEEGKCYIIEDRDDFDEIDAICEMIMATRIPQTPANLMQEILCDADLDYLGRDDYFMICDRLLMEIKRTNEDCTKCNHDKCTKHHQHKSYSYIPH